MHVLFAPFGTEGDVRPHVALAQAMASRGHRITFLANPYFRKLIEHDHATLIPIDTEEAYRRDAHDPRVWRPVSGLFRVVDIVKRTMELTFDALRDARFDLVIGNTFSIAAMSWAERARIPRLILHLQPMSLRSATDVPVLGAGLEWAARLPPWSAHAWFAALDFVSRPLLVPINMFRRRHGLRMVHRFEWLWHNAEGEAALFPPWLGAPQPDWPRNLRQFDALRVVPQDATLPEAVERFLAQGEAPIVWTQGSYPTSLERFSTIARETTKRLGMRSIVVGLPGAADDDRDFLRVPYALHAVLLPRSRALVHHGGVGTSFEAIAAGIPQLVVPRAADQIDNGRRLVRLGLARRESSREFDAASASAALRELLTSSTIAQACREYRGRLIAANPLPDLCAYAESLAARSP